LDALRQDTEEGRALLAAVVSLLATLGRSSAPTISLDEAERSADALRASAFNGDGVIVPASTDDPTLRSVIADAVACLGGKPDRSGQSGVDAALVDAFLADLAAHDAWRTRAASAEVRRFGDGTEAASAAARGGAGESRGLLHPLTSGPVRPPGRRAPQPRYR
jgi:hypothetical protein